MTSLTRRSFVVGISATLLASASGVRADDVDGPVRDFPFLADESAEGSCSVGDSSDGYLVGAHRLNESDHLRILPRQKDRGLRFGTDGLIASLELAAEALRQTHGRPLWVGNLSRANGGDIPWSVSHNSGRDADVAFAYLDRRGNPADPPDLVSLDARGAAPEFGLRFDAPRTWRVVRALLESPHAEVQYLFISNPLKRMLVAHAEKTKEPAELVARASEILRQPLGSGAHDDHLHVRIYCSERDALAGCVDSGVAHAWHLGHDDAKRRRTVEVTRALASPEAEQRRRAIDRLVILGARDRIREIAEGVDDESPGVRAAAAAAIASFGAERYSARLESRWDREHDTTVKIALVQAAGVLGCSSSGRLLAKGVGRPEHSLGEFERAALAWRDARPPVEVALARRLLEFEGRLARMSPLLDLFAPALELDESWLLPLDTAAALERALQLAAIASASSAERLEPVPALIELLRSNDSQIRDAADRALSFILNVARQLSPREQDGARAHDHWKALVGPNPSLERTKRLVAGFRAAGFRVPELDQRHAWELVRAVAGADHISFNAQRTLMRLVDHRPPSLTWPKRDACEHWLRWLRIRARDFEIGPPPSGLTEACARAEG